MFRVNILRNFSNITKKLLTGQPQSVITNVKNPLYSTAVKCPLGKNAFDNIKNQKSLLQAAKSIAPKIIQVRGTATAGDHVRLWQLERILSVALVPLFPAMFLIDSKILETLCSAIVVIHTYWGFEAIIVDYMRPSVVGPVAPKVAHMALYAFSALILAGLLVLIHNGDGIAKSVKKGWAIGQRKQ